MSRTYTVEKAGVKFATICRTDGYWSITWRSKNKRAAHRKGQEFIDGTRTATVKYTTAYGRAINEARSNIPRRNTLAMAVAATFGNN